MFGVSIWIIMPVVLADGILSANQFSRVIGGDGHPVCSVNEPSATIYDVRRPVSCLLEHCVPTKACFSANYYTITGKCELFHYPPTDFFRITGDCKHYKVIRIRIISESFYWIVTSNHSDLHTIRYDKFEFKIIHSMSTFNETPVVLLIW